MLPISPKVAADLQSTLALLRSGQHLAARKLLAEILALQPDLVDAHWMLSGSLYQTGDMAGAQEELQTVVRLDPTCAPAHVLLGRILISQDKLDAAVQVLRHALHLRSDPDAASSLARALLMQARAEDALAVLQPFAKTGNFKREIWLLHGYALMSLGRSGEAALVFQEILQSYPQDADARIKLAAAFSDSGRHAEAETHARAGMAQGAHSPEAHFVLGRSLLGQNKRETAEQELRAAVSAQPDHVIAQANLCELVWMRSGDLKAASEEINKALRLHPHLSQLRVAKARLLLAAGACGPALECIEEGIEHASIPSNLLELHIVAAQIALETDAPRALNHGLSALRLAPGDRLAVSAYGDSLLATGAATQAAAVANDLLRSDPTDGRALALLASALRMAGDARYRELYDYENLVLAQRMDTPDGWSALQDYLSDLASALQRLHLLSAHPIGQSLRQGTQVELDLERSTEPAIRAFAHAAAGPIRHYLARLGNGGDPMRARNTGNVRIKGCWSVKLKPGGFHVNHYHPEGWLSSACYILPPALNAAGREGWLKLGEPGFPTRPALPAEHFVRPEPGLLALFPSYMWHGTVPFSGNSSESRLAIAFDAIPA